MKLILLALTVAFVFVPFSAQAASAKNYSTTDALTRHQASVVPLSSCGNGNDFYDGGPDTDTLQYSGTRSEFHITLHLDKSYTFKDKVACRADTDTVINVELIQFSDGTLSLSKLKPDVTEKKAKKKKGGELESLPYVTAGGVAVIKPPKGWAASVTLKDKKPEAAVFFTNSEKTINLQVAVNIPMSEKDNPLAQAERLISLYATSGTFGGKTLSGSLVSKKVVNLGDASGYRVEIKRTDLSGKWRIVEWVVATSGPDYYYSVGAKVPEKEWKKYKTVIESSFKTLQIP